MSSPKIPEVDTAAKAELAALVAELAVVRGKVVLSSGREADYYVDLRRVTLHHRAAPLIGTLMRQLTADWPFTAVGGLTLGADPVATAIMHAPGPALNAFVVRKAAKAHGMQRQIEGPDITGAAVLIVEDTTTTGGSPLTAYDAVIQAGASVVGIATILDRGAEAAAVIGRRGIPYRYVLDLGDLGLRTQ
ncbi:orotate phosphoribosyltransferase [Nakamurella antarctica]|uniref:Orotate phosphoribosyltransferase n=1 Tax=Nakamurella antarctica TaxID=1902245 RepID=A0A3G8ZPM9_9ACTN|nr:orotate phosphoribosyltransferase [Nakamurella antarctica]AZI59098.1 orotate phosphoribosyltransferase [Nakamurella antarctica]